MRMIAWQWAITNHNPTSCNLHSLKVFFKILQQQASFLQMATKISQKCESCKFLQVNQFLAIFMKVCYKYLLDLKYMQRSWKINLAARVLYQKNTWKNTIKLLIVPRTYQNLASYFRIYGSLVVIWVFALFKLCLTLNGPETRARIQL